MIDYDSIEAAMKQEIADDVLVASAQAYAEIPITSYPLVATYTWNGTGTVTTPNTSEVKVGYLIKLNSNNKWYKISAINPNVSVTVIDAYQVGSFPSGSTPSSKSEISIPTFPLPGPANPLLKTFGEPIANGVRNAIEAVVNDIYPWQGIIVGAKGDGNPNAMLQDMINAPAVLRPSYVTTTVARCCYFMLDQDITVNAIRVYGDGAVAATFQCALYRDSDSARLTSQYQYDTTGGAWTTVVSSLGLTLLAGVLYFIATSVNSTVGGSGPHCCSSGTGVISLPSVYPGSLATNSYRRFAYSQFAVVGGALPNPASGRSLAVWTTGGVPAYFLDSVN